MQVNYGSGTGGHLELLTVRWVSATVVINKRSFKKNGWDYVSINSCLLMFSGLLFGSKTTNT